MGQALQLLLIEDSADDAEFIVGALRRGGFSVVPHRVDTAAETRQSLQRQPWDLVIADYQMPGFTGLDALVLVREHDVNLPFILVSGVIGEDRAVAAMKGGAQDYLMKGHLARLAPAVERELREAALRRDRQQTECRLAAIVESSSDAIMGKNLDGIILTWNQAAERLLGYRAEEIIGQSILRLVPPERQAEETQILARIRVGEKIENLDTMRVARDGRRIDVALTISPIHDASRRVVGVSTIARDITARRQAEALRAAWQRELEQQVAARTADLRVAQHKLQAAFDHQRQLEALITRAIEQEKLRLGQELHDGLGQKLTGLNYLLQALETSLDHWRRLFRRSLKKVRDLAQASVDETRRLAKGFYPVDMERLGLVAALAEMVQSASHAATPLCGRMEADAAVARLAVGETVAIQLFRIAQESLHNAIKHARAQAVMIRLEIVAGQLVLTIRDDGVGLPADYRHASGMGLRIMRHRAETIGGQFQIAAAPGGGTLVTCRVALDALNLRAGADAHAAAPAARPAETAA